MSTSGSPGRPVPAAPCQPSSSSSSSSVDSSDYQEPRPWAPGLDLPVGHASLLSRRLLRCSGRGPVSRRRREMIPHDKKDALYWNKRLKNNEAAKRSREKKKLAELLVEGHLLALSDENARLRARVLNLQYHNSLSAGKSRVTSAEASILAPRQTHPPALLQTAPWGDSRCSPVSVLGVWQQERAINPYEAMVPSFSVARGVGAFDPHSPHSCGAHQGLPPLYGPRVFSPRSSEAEMEAQRQVSSIDDIPNSTHVQSHPATSTRAFLPTPDTLPRTSILSYQPPNWLVPHVILPWRSSYLAPPSLYPGEPVYMHERPALDLGADADIHTGYRSRFSTAPTPAPAGPSHRGAHLSPEGH